MELPRALREALDAALEGVTSAELARASAALSQRYRSEIRDGRLHVGDDSSARAYLAARMPATFAAVHAAMDAAARLAPGFAPRRLLDVGAGPGTAAWAAADCWPSLAEATLVETSGAMRRWGERLGSAVERVVWHDADVTMLAPEPHDLVTLAYVLGELDPAAGSTLVARIWAATMQMLLIVEPGTPAGWARVLEARRTLINAGAHIVAPCPHAAACPLTPPDWCHFAARLARSRVHRLAKDAEVPWEDEKYIYLAAARTPAGPIAARVLASPRHASGQVRLKLCRRDGSAAEQLITRREGERYRTARRLEWGDVVE